MRLTRRLPIVVLLTGAHTLAAQLPLVTIGQRMRVSYDCRVYLNPYVMRSGCVTEEGRFVEMTGDTILLTLAGATRSFDVTKLSRLELQTGYDSHWQSGAVAGFALGTGAGLYFVSGGDDFGFGNSFFTCYGEPAKCIALALVFGGVPGGLLGGIIGGLAKTERWELVPGGRIRTALEPVRGGLGIGVAVRL